VNVPDQASAIGWFVLSLAALLGIGAGCVGLFVLRVEFIQALSRIKALEDRERAGE